MTANASIPGNAPLNLPGGDDEVLFAVDDGDEVQIAQDGTWEVLIVDDEDEVHTVTKLALDDFVFDNKSPNFSSAHSGVEALEALERNPDTSVVLLDVVMEDDDAGLLVARELRDR